MIADTLSRVASLKQSSKTATIVSVTYKGYLYIKSHRQHTSTQRLQVIREATAKDSALRLLTDTVHEGWPKTINSKSLTHGTLCD